MTRNSLEITRETLRRHVEAFLADPHRNSLANVVLSLIDYQTIYWQRWKEQKDLEI